jgi:RNA polymerase sigma-70 factor, ECF subfamily
MRALEYEADERLLIEAAQRDPLQFGRLYEANFERVYAYIVRRVGDRDAAQELTAEVFHQALANIGKFEWRGVPFVAWLLRMAANAVRDRWKRGSREQELPDELLAESGAGEEIERRAMLFRMVDQLPEDQRVVIVRRFVEQKSTREIAQELGKTEGAVKQLQFRALMALRGKVRSKYV